MPLSFPNKGKQIPRGTQLAFCCSMCAVSERMIGDIIAAPKPRANHHLFLHSDSNGVDFLAWNLSRITLKSSLISAGLAK